MSFGKFTADTVQDSSREIFQKDTTRVIPKVIDKNTDVDSFFAPTAVKQKSSVDDRPAHCLGTEWTNIGK